MLNKLIKKSPHSKQVSLENFCAWFFRNPKKVSFINPVNYVKLQENQKLLDSVDYFFFDGIFASKWMGFLFGNKYARLSFDFTSIARMFFKYCSVHEKKVFILGGNVDELNNFIELILKNFPRLKIVGSHHGYIENEDIDKIIHQLNECDFDTLICGMGCPKQEHFISSISEIYPSKTYITCGGFIHQTQHNTRYYPEIINQLNLRMPYRYLKEPHTRRRIIYYPLFLYFTISQLIRNT